MPMLNEKLKMKNEKEKFKTELKRRIYTMSQGDPYVFQF